MPRVQTIARARASKFDRRCAAVHCKLAAERDDDRTIRPGDSYYTWKFRYGGARCQHVACGYPRRSQLTQSAMGEVYEAIETAESELARWDGDQGQLGWLTEIIETVAETAGAVRDQYREADEAFGGSGATPNAERADELDGWVDELESFYPDEWDGEFDDDGQVLHADDEERERFDNWADEQRGAAQDILDNCPL